MCYLRHGFELGENIPNKGHTYGWSFHKGFTHFTFWKFEWFDANGTWEPTNLVHNNWLTSLSKEFDKSINLASRWNDDDTWFTKIGFFFTSTTWSILLATKVAVIKVKMLSKYFYHIVTINFVPTNIDHPMHFDEP